MLQDIYNTYVSLAKILGDYQAMTKTELANGYCDADEAGEETVRSAYFSALMLRYWYKIFEFQKDSPNVGLDLDDFSSWLSEALMQALNARKWRDPDNKLYEDKNGPDKVINMWCSTIRLRHYYQFNLDNNRANFGCDSIDRQIEAYGDSAECMQQCTVDSHDEIGIKGLINDLFKRNKILEAIIVDSIVYQNTWKTIKSTVTYFDEVLQKDKKAPKEVEEFSKRSLLEFLSNINKEESYYVNTYGIDRNMFSLVANKLSSLPRTKLNSLLNKTLANLKDSEGVKAYLCI